VSRVGKKPISIPSNVKMTIADSSVKIDGPKGSLLFKIPPEIKVAIDKEHLIVSRESEIKSVKQKHGMVRAIINNMVIGVTKQFERNLEISGVGYKVEKKGSDLIFNIGYSHPVVFNIPATIEAAVEKNKIRLKGSDKKELGQIAARIRSIKHADPYKIKGIKFAGERIKQKVGKTGAA